jgi:predicted metal-dependent enzyme (double-stranded beta helix superfamily)
LVELLDEAGDDVLSRQVELTACLQDLLSLPNLDSVNANPAWSNPSDDGPSAGWLYQDGDLRITRGRLPAGFTLPPHNHGAWNLFGVYDGAVKYTSYRRRDDRQVEYYADLEVADDRIMRASDVTILPAPPHDIHTITGLASLSTTILVARGTFAPVRERYLPDEQCYVLTEGEARGYYLP